jgi:WD40 repeat protein
VTKDGSNARKKAARDLAAAEQIPYTEALRRIDQRAARTPSAGEENTATAGAARVSRARVTPPVAALTTGVVLIGHTDRVDSVVFHPDGRTLATGGDVTVRLWDLATRQTTSVLTGEADVVSVAFSPDGSILAAADSDATVSLWTIATGQVTALTGFTGRVGSVAFSPDGRTLASSETHLVEHGGQGRPVAFGPDGRPSLAATQTQPEQHGPVASGVHTSTTITVRLWDLATGQAATLASLPDSFGRSVLVFHPNGHTLIGGAGMDWTIQLVDLATGQVTALAGHTSVIDSAAFSPDGRTLATGSSDKTVKLWDLATGQATATLTHHGGYVLAVAFSPDGRTLAAASSDTVRLWDLATGQVTATLLGHTDLVWSVAFSPDGHTLATGSQDKTVRLWALG